MIDIQTDGSTDESDDVQMEGNFPMIQTFTKFHPAILVGIFTMNLADSWMAGTNDGHTDGWMEFQAESHSLDRQTCHVTDIWTDLSCD